MNWRAAFKGLVFLFSLAVAAVVLKATNFGADIDEAWVNRVLLHHGAASALWFVGAAALATAMGFPRQAVSFLAGYGFGVAEGTLVGVAGTLAGCMLSFYYARLLGRGFVRRRFLKRVQRFDAFLGRHPLSMTLLVRLLPVGNNLVTNLVAGVSSVGALPYFTGSGLGYVPQTAIFALVGSGVNVQSGVRIGVGGVLLVCSGLLGLWLYRRHRAEDARAPDMLEDLDRPEAGGPPAAGT
ncbi:MAG: TVP38/TMEM64 family protein [Gammaproteobacteria bacterium]|nr:TVP38/TMEM64 family protein [Gammaproteobacteria bacterium]MBI5615641.1 TVP38/TMEM64 family protein [Gammaproteobacteria bacterium]